MHASPLRKIAILLLSFMFILTSFPLAAFADSAYLSPEYPAEEAGSQSTEPEGTEPPSSEPEITESNTPEPDPSEPEPTAPEPAAPENAGPNATEPTPSEPDASDPDAAEPDAPEPVPPVPEATEPDVTESAPTELEMTDLTEDEPNPPDVEASGPGLFFGLLHAHSGISDASSSVEASFQTAVQTDGLDFFAVTDHSDSFENHKFGQIGTDSSTVSSSWASGKAAAQAVTSSSFVGIYGYEMSWPSQMKIGHLSTFGTPGFQSWDQEPYQNYRGALKTYYETLSLVPGAVSQFNHPGTQYGTFNGFEYSASADQYISLIELDFNAKNPCQNYIKALDRGWHLAPTGCRETADSVRTAVYAQTLTETDLLNALGSCRAYATEDPDLEILYSMDNHFMGSRLDLRHVGDTLDISIDFLDPTDHAMGLVEVITTGGSVAAQQAFDAPSGTMDISLPTVSGYYFLRITQPDGDRAVTAPIWVDAEEELGIAALVCETPVPVQNENIHLKLELYNRENADLLVTSLEILADGNRICADAALPSIPGNTAFCHSIHLSCDCVGSTTITIRLTGTLEGSPRSYEASLPLRFHQSEQVTAILADNSHGNQGLDTLNTLKALALRENIQLTIGDVTADTLKNCRFLLVSAPTRPFSESFLSAAAEFAGYGGSLVICGQADRLDTDVHSAAELNRLLEAVGAGLRFGDDLVQDPINNGGSSLVLNTSGINTSLPWCDGISADQVYRFQDSCTVIPGSGTWLVKGRSTTFAADGDGDGLGGTEPGNAVILACEPLSGGGTVFAAGSLFLRDDALKEPDNIRDLPYSNRSLAHSLLGIGGEAIPLSTIQDARNGSSNALFRVRGYVTAGTANPYNIFPDTLYLQDETGGIAVTAFPQAGIQTGTAMEITGYAQTQNGNQVLKASDWEILNQPMYFIQPKTGNWPTLLDPAENGGALVEVTGTCLEIYCREDNTIAGCLLEDKDGNLAKIQIEDYISAGSDGENDLHKTIRKGRTVWAIGLLHVNEYGDTVIRARNCEEVVYVPPRTYINPRTGDAISLAVLGFFASPTCLLLLHKKKRT